MKDKGSLSVHWRDRFIPHAHFFPAFVLKDLDQDNLIVLYNSHEAMISFESIYLAKALCINMLLLDLLLPSCHCKAKLERTSAVQSYEAEINHYAAQIRIRVSLTSYCCSLVYHSLILMETDSLIKELTFKVRMYVAFDRGFDLMHVPTSTKLLGSLVAYAYRS